MNNTAIKFNPFVFRLKDESYSFPEFMLIVAVFSKEIASKNILGIDFDLISYTFYILYFVSHLPQVLSSKRVPYLLFFYVIVSSMISILTIGLAFGGFIKQFMPILIILSTTFYLITRENIVRLFHLYCVVAYITAIFGIIQVLLSFGGINILIKIPGKLDSIAYEPSHYAAILLPALIFAFFNFRKYKKMVIVMLIALVLTFNVTGYVVFLVILSIAFVNPVYIVISIPVIYLVIFNLLPTINPYFKMRFMHSLDVLQQKKDILRRGLTVNGTTLSFFSNLEVAFYSLKQNFITGCGLGGHEEVYFKRFENTSFRYNYYYGLNAKSAHSLTIRVLSEFGLLGIVLYVFTLIKSVLFFPSGTSRAMALACLSHFLCKTLKLGGYIDYGTPFFFSILILNAHFFQLKKK